MSTASIGAAIFTIISSREDNFVLSSPSLSLASPTKYRNVCAGANSAKFHVEITSKIEYADLKS